MIGEKRQTESLFYGIAGNHQLGDLCSGHSLVSHIEMNITGIPAKDIPVNFK